MMIPENNTVTYSTRNLKLSLYQDTCQPGFNSKAVNLHGEHSNCHCSIWILSGCVSNNSTQLNSGDGAFFDSTDTLINNTNTPAVLLRFTLTDDESSTEDLNKESFQSSLIMTQVINMTSEPFVFRLDQVDFPPSAVAYKHTHPGPGIRYLVFGELNLHSEHGTQKINTGNAWYEAANSPVKAVAQDAEPTRFIRAILLPLEYEGRSSFALYNQSDANKPTLQKNTRHCEKRVLISHSSH